MLPRSGNDLVFPIRYELGQRIGKTKSLPDRGSISGRFKTFWGVQGKVCFPLTSPYHGCPANLRVLRRSWPLVEQKSSRHTKTGRESSTKQSRRVSGKKCTTFWPSPSPPRWRCSAVEAPNPCG